MNNFKASVRDVFYIEEIDCYWLCYAIEALDYDTYRGLLYFGLTSKAKNDKIAEKNSFSNAEANDSNGSYTLPNRFYHNNNYDRIICFANTNNITHYDNTFKPIKLGRLTKNEFMDFLDKYNDYTNCLSVREEV